MGEKKVLHKKILVVEDMEGIRMMLRRSIHHLFDEVEVVLCESAEEASYMSVQQELINLRKKSYLKDNILLRCFTAEQCM